MTPVELLARCLRAGEDLADAQAIREAFAAPAFDDVAFMELANRHACAPALASALSRKGLEDALPGAAIAYLGELFVSNRKRNLHIRRQIVEIGQALAPLDARPVLLKGAAYLFDDVHEDVGARMLADVDILVDERHLQPAVRALIARGYLVQDADRAWSYHFLPLYRRGELAPVEFHHDLGEQRHVMRGSEARARAVPLLEPAAPLFVLDATTRLLHGVFHAELQDRAMELGTVPLKALLDCDRLVRAQGDAIDWAFARARLGRALDIHLALAETLLALPAPYALPEDAKRKALGRLRPRREAFDDMVALWAGLTDPLKSSKIDYLYGTAGRPLGRQFQRGRHLLRAVARHVRRSFRGVGS